MANKPTVVRAYTLVGDYQKDEDLTDIEVSLHGYRDGVELPGSPLDEFNETDTAFHSVDRGSNGYPEFFLPIEWTAAGTITVRAQVNPQGPNHYEEKNTSNNEASLTLQFQETPVFSIRTLRVCQPGADGQKDCAKGMGGEAFFTLFNMLPAAWVGDNAVDYDIWDTEPLDWPRPLNTAEEWDRLIVALEATYNVAIDREILSPS